MKLEMLQKLIALANNNPNDNEANLAARKVCKAIVEHKFIITHQGQPNTYTSPPPIKPTNKPPSSDWDIFNRDPFSKYNPYEDFFNERTRGTRTENRTKYYTGKPPSQELRDRENTWQYEYYVAATNQYYNPLTRRHYDMMFQDLWLKEMKIAHISDTPSFRKNANYGRPQEEPPKSHKYAEDEKYYKRKKEREFGDDVRRLKCKTCGQIKNTKFMGLAEVFECNECQWESFTKRDNPKVMRTCGECRTPISCSGDGYCHKKGTAI